MQEQLKAYKAVHEVIIANKQHLNVSDFWDIENKIEQLEKSVEWNMTLEGHGTWYTHYLYNMNEAHVGLYGRDFNRTISWSDDKRQPEGEWLCSIRFPFGAYMFNDSARSSFYPEETFDAFFAELKAFGTAYCDTNNRVLYFTKDVAYKVCEAFPEIYKKYKALLVEERQRQRVKELELELARLKEMNHLQGLDIKVVGKWPTLPKNFNRKENTMQYMTNKMLQRFMSHMTTTLKYIQIDRAEIEDEIEYMKDVGGSSHPKYQNMLGQWYKYREGFKIRYVKNSKLQEHVKRGFIGHRTLQKMEKVVTTWILQEQQNCSFAYENYLENRYDPFYRNKSKQAKKKLAKLEELQQAIRKQKSITEY